MRRNCRCFKAALAISGTLSANGKRDLHRQPVLAKAILAALRPLKEPYDLRTDLLWLIPALVSGFLVYANTLGGEFVYDDQRQIVRNILIQDGSQFWRAMTSDVWGAFSGGEQAVSNYWRPSFVLWMILNFRWFGLATFGWHLTNTLLHLAVVALAFAVLRRLAVSRPISGAIALLFAVHPVHSESVAWISGAPDLILGTALLGSLWFVNLLGERKTALRWVLAIGLYLVALGAKEIAILYPLIVVAVLSWSERSTGKKSDSWRSILSTTVPFAAVAIIYLIIRHSILGTSGGAPEGAAGLGETILTVPAVFEFYLRQILVPFWIGPSYPLRAVTPGNIGASNFIIPLVVTTIAAWWMIRTAKQSKTARIGLVLFLTLLFPAMNIAVFHPEQLVHDRYLYVPLLGFLMLAIPALASGLQRLGGERMVRSSVPIFIVAMIVSVPLAAQTLSYNRAWTSNLALWEWGVRSDANSSLNYQQYGVQLHMARRLEEAIAAFNRSIEIAPADSTYIARSSSLMGQQKFADAESDLRRVTSKKWAPPYTLYRAYKGLAISLAKQKKLNEAADAIREARRRLPRYSAALTGDLAIILYDGGRKNEALSELIAARAQARTESLPESRLLLHGLGLLYVELGRPGDARDAFQEFLSLTRGMLTPEITKARSDSEIALRSLGH